MRRFRNACYPDTARFASRRDFLWNAGGGLGGVALAWLLDHEQKLQADDRTNSAQPTTQRSPSTTHQTSLAPKAGHFPGKAKRVIQLFMAGAVSHLDSFDPKPELELRDGQLLPGSEELDLFFGKQSPGNILKSPWPAKPRGQSGILVTDLFPELAESADHLTIIRSMQAKSSSHGPAMFQMNTGFVQQGYPALGSWVCYGLGTESQDLPAFVVLPDPRGMPPSGPVNWSAGFLPSVYQGTAFRHSGDPILDLSPPTDVSPAAERASRRLLAKLNERHLAANPGDAELAARISAYELAARMQLSAPTVIDFSDETEATAKLYGLDNPATAGFGRSCLLARRLVERGVRFVQVYGGAYNTSPRINWDAHEDIRQNHGENAAMMDRPMAGLLQDLKERGLWDDTLVVWCTEFGRMPVSQGKGRDHNPDGFTGWMAGAGLRAGMVYGATDEFGWKVVEDPCTIYDFHATILHLLGLDHERLTYYHNGRQQRLTDVHGVVIRGILG